MMWGPYYYQSELWMWGGMLVPLLLGLAFIGAVIWAVSRLTRAQQGRQGSPFVGQATSEEILRRRYASGEIDEQTYKRMREQLEPTKPLVASTPKP